MALLPTNIKKSLRFCTWLSEGTLQWKLGIKSRLNLHQKTVIYREKCKLWDRSATTFVVVFSVK